MRAQVKDSGDWDAFYNQCPDCGKPMPGFHKDDCAEAIYEDLPATKTPRTDAASNIVANRDGSQIEWVTADFARTLELKIQALQKLIPCDGTGACGDGKCVACKLLNEQAAHDQTKEQLAQLKAAGEELAKQIPLQDYNHPWPNEDNETKIHRCNSWERMKQALTKWQILMETMK